MTNSQRITIRLSECRQRLNELLGLDARDDAQQGELEALTGEVGKIEPELRAAIAAEGITDEPGGATLDPETRERLDLRRRSHLGAYLAAALSARVVGGAEAEYAAACKVQTPGAIPLDIFEEDRPAVEHRERELRADAATVAPTTGTGATLAPIQPYVFAESIAGRLGIEMPQVPSGAYSEATITTALSAGATAKGSARESTAATLTPVTTSPRRISTRLTVQSEDVAAIGQGNFEAALRSNARMALSAEYDNQCINGNGTAPAVNGLINQLTNPADPTDVADFDAFLKAFSDQIDGLWARTLAEVAILANVDAYKLSAGAFRDGTDDKGDMSFADYAAENLGGWWTNARMPASANNIARGIVYRGGRPGLRTACHPVWGELAIDDIYSDSASATRHFSLHVLVGDKVLLVQSAAYGLVEFKVA